MKHQAHSCQQLQVQQKQRRLGSSGSSSNNDDDTLTNILGISSQTSTELIAVDWRTFLLGRSLIELLRFLGECGSE
jgi:hypothetical protein